MYHQFRNYMNGSTEHLVTSKLFLNVSISSGYDYFQPPFLNVPGTSNCLRIEILREFIICTLLFKSILRNFFIFNCSYISSAFYVFLFFTFFT
jgi:hypothetical protein